MDLASPLKLYEVTRKWKGEPFIVRLTSNPNRPDPIKKREGLLFGNYGNQIPHGYRVYLDTSTAGEIRQSTKDIPQPLVPLPPSLHYLNDGDIVRLNPSRGKISVLFRANSRFNSMLVTELCNSNCIMCSQPPRNVEDRTHVDDLLTTIPLIDMSTGEIGITGGEPTLLGDNLFRIVQACRNFLPRTSIHILSNGRLFSYLSLCEELASIKHPDLMIGIPLYSQVANEHDFIVQAHGAFDQTIRGMLNLSRCGLRVELRVVIHKLNAERLPGLAQFIVSNLPFVHHVALMGLEFMGFAKANLEMLWIDPYDYRFLLREAVRKLAAHRICVSIYNHQLCVLDPENWSFACKSISDWKNMYLDCCASCAVHEECGGLFSSAAIRHSEYIRPVRNV